ncbi:MAG TPA: hypothetical protein VNK67_12140 [Burkholderiales bacterium]|nr:hypothetical protein [Burkholderiales bacterium]
MDARTEDPLFRTVDGALLFSLNYAHGQVRQVPLAQLVGGAAKGRGLGGLDGAAQAGMIRAELMRLHPLRRAILTARFAAPTTPCACRSPCCRGYRESAEWAEAVETVVEAALRAAAAGTISHYQLRRALVGRYFGVRVSFIEVASRCKVNRDTASDYYRRMTDWLKREEKLARYEIEDHLRQAGVVEA